MLTFLVACILLTVFVGCPVLILMFLGTLNMAWKQPKK